MTDQFEPWIFYFKLASRNEKCAFSISVVEMFAAIHFRVFVSAVINFVWIKCVLRYLDIYKKYADLLNNKAEVDVIQFIKQDNMLHDYVQMINKFEVRNESLGGFFSAVP